MTSTNLTQEFVALLSNEKYSEQDDEVENNDDWLDDGGNVVIDDQFIQDIEALTQALDCDLDERFNELGNNSPSWQSFLRNFKSAATYEKTVKEFLCYFLKNSITTAGSEYTFDMSLINYFDEKHDAGLAPSTLQSKMAILKAFYQTQRFRTEPLASSAQQQIVMSGNFNVGPGGIVNVFTGAPPSTTTASSASVTTSNTYASVLTTDDKE